MRRAAGGEFTSVTVRANTRMYEQRFCFTSIFWDGQPQLRRTAKTGAYIVLMSNISRLIPM